MNGVKVQVSGVVEGEVIMQWLKWRTVEDYEGMWRNEGD